MAREPALHAPLPRATGRAAMRLLRQYAALLSERVHPLLSDLVVVVGLRCGKANSKTLPPAHEVVVGLRCGKVNTKTPRSFARLDPVFPRDSSGRSILFPIKEESSRFRSYLAPLLQEG